MTFWLTVLIIFNKHFYRLFTLARQLKFNNVRLIFYNFESKLSRWFVYGKALMVERLRPLPQMQDGVGSNSTYIKIC